MIPWKNIETTALFGVDQFACIKGGKHSVYSINLYQIDVSTLVKFTTYIDGVFKANPGLQRAIWGLVQYAGRVINSVPDEATAYAWRKAIAYV